MSKIQNPKSKIQNSARAFTLVELMVVLAILAGLLGLIAPQLLAVRERAKGTQCRNNLRQYGAVLTQQRMVTDSGFQTATTMEETEAAAGSYSVIPAAEGDTSIIKVKGEDGNEVEIPWSAMYDELIGEGGPGVNPAVSIEIFITETLSSEIRHCPAVDYQSLVNPNSSSFKGTQTATNVDTTYWTEYYSPTNVADTYVLTSTYASNPVAYASYNAVAYIDWNAAEGWGGVLSYSNYQYRNTLRNIWVGKPKWTNVWWRTEIGFHHREGWDRHKSANYVSWDGHVGSVSSNDISLAYFTNAWQ